MSSNYRMISGGFIMKTASNIANKWLFDWWEVNIIVLSSNVLNYSQYFAWETSVTHFVSVVSDWSHLKWEICLIQSVLWIQSKISVTKQKQNHWNQISFCTHLFKFTHIYWKQQWTKYSGGSWDWTAFGFSFLNIYYIWA